MKLKIFLVGLILIFSVCFAVGASAMTDAERQALIAQIQAQILAIQQRLIELLSTQEWCHTFNTNLGYPNSGTAEVGSLHLALVKQGISYTPDGMNTYANGTYQAVVAFQAKYGITPQSGYVGPATRTKLNSLYGCGTTPTGCEPDWQCTNWSACSGGQQTKTCQDYNYCGTLSGKPVTTRICTGDDVTIGDTTCQANCVSNADGIFAVDCDGSVEKCGSGEICKKEYDISYTYKNGGIQTVKTLTGSNCETQTTCQPEWDCSEWGSCVNGQQDKTCTDTNSCGTTAGKPATSRTCVEATCQANCLNQTEGIFSVDCDGQLTKCDTGEICQKIYDTTWTYVGGVAVPKTDLTGSECTSEGVCQPDWDCSDWGACINGSQQKTCVDNNKCGVTTGRPTLTQACTCQPKWDCTDWGICSAAGVHTRTCTDTNSCGTTVGKLPETENCTPIPAVSLKAENSKEPLTLFLKLGNGASVVPGGIHLSANVHLSWDSIKVGSCAGSETNTPQKFSGYKPTSGAETVLLSGDIDGLSSSDKVTSTYQINCISTTTGQQVSDTITANLFYTTDTACTPSWSCAPVWGLCTKEGMQYRSCIDTNGCGTLNGKPSTSQACTYVCLPQWSCTTWSVCDTTGIHTRTCTDTNDCGTDAGKLPESESCVCVPDWHCTSWVFNGSYQYTRTCTDVSTGGCGTDANKPTTYRCYPYCPVACTDTDGGKDYYHTGYISAPNYPTYNTGAPGTHDTCTNRIEREYYCDGDTGRYEYHDCPDGCNNDSCASCASLWNCTPWSSCPGGTQTRSCSDQNNCTVKSPAMPEISRTCTTCTSLWNCTPFGTCWPAPHATIGEASSGIWTKTCTDTHSCEFPTTTKPAESATCTALSSLNWQCAYYGTVNGGDTIKISNNAGEQQLITDRCYEYGKEVASCGSNGTNCKAKWFHCGGAPYLYDYGLADCPKGCSNGECIP